MNDVFALVLLQIPEPATAVIHIMFNWDTNY